jgi:putative ABC transport system permease protein
MPGVMRVEGGRDIAVRLGAGHRAYRTIVAGLAPDAELRRLLDANARPVALPLEGIVLADRLAARLAVRPGDRIRVEVLTGERRSGDVLVAGTVADLFGLTAYMSLDQLAYFTGEPDTLSSFSVIVDRSQSQQLFARMKEIPRIATVASKTAMLRNFRESSARNVLFFTSVLTAFACVIAVGVIYNHARIALQEHAWELATLRVLGFTRGEVSTLLLGELAFEVALALPLGAALGYALAWVMVTMEHNDMISIPIVIAPRTYVLAAGAVVLAGVASAMIVRRRIDLLDLVGVLKTRE